MSANLFDAPSNSPINYLPCDGVVHYHHDLLTQVEADQYFNAFREKIRWQSDLVRLFGKLIRTRRQVAWYGSKPFAYTYSQQTKLALPWTEELVTLKKFIEIKTGEHFNSCLLNLYQSGDVGMGWHSDDEKDLQPNAAIASVSLGASRKFVFRHKTSKEKVSLQLDHGSLLMMLDSTQIHWLHHLPPSRRIKQPRINLTFRTIADH